MYFRGYSFLDIQQGRANNDKTYKKTLEITKKHLKSSDIVLDYACATGLYSIELAGNVKEIHGIDISSKMIEAAERKATEHKIGDLPPKRIPLLKLEFPEFKPHPKTVQASRL